jgi:hypothetical protein
LPEIAAATSTAASSAKSRLLRMPPDA